MTWKFPTEVNKAGRLRAVPLQSVESKLGRTGESELAERETGERRLLPSFPSAFARFARFPRSRNHPEGLLAVYKAGSAFWAINSWRISYSSNEKGTEAKKRPAIVSGILTSDASFCYWPIFPLPLVTVPELEKSLRKLTRSSFLLVSVAKWRIKKPYTPCLWEICQWPIETASPFNIFRGKCAISPAANTPSHDFRYCKNYKTFLNKAAGSEKHYFLSSPQPPPTRSSRHFRLWRTAT